MNAHELADEIDALADEHGEVDENDRPTVMVEYETDHGNTRSREGEVWNIDTDPYQWRDDTVVRFSANAGDVDEDPYYIAIRGDDAVLVSISLKSDTETNLGEITNIKVDGLASDDEQPVATDGGAERPDDCECVDYPNSDDDALACWPCAREGFDTRNPDAPTFDAGEADDIEILDAQIEWNDDVLNDPELKVQISEYPDIDEMTFTEYDLGDMSLYYGESRGLARYFVWSGDGNDGGFGGDTWDVTLESGERVTLKGPYSSRDGIVNKHEFGPVVSMGTTTEQRVLNGEGGTFRHRALTLEKAREALEHIDEDVELVRTEKYDADEVYYVPQRVNGEPTPPRPKPQTNQPE